jgi:hypothetical protein
MKNLAELCGAQHATYGRAATELQRAASNALAYIQRTGLLYVDGVGNTDHIAICAPFGEGKKVSDGLVLCFAGDDSNDAIRWREALEGTAFSLVTGLGSIDEALEVVGEAYGDRAKPALDARARDLANAAPTEVKKTRRFNYR